MPPNRRAYLVRRLTQADRNIYKSMAYMARMAKTFEPYYPEYTKELIRIIRYAEFLRVLMLSFHRRAFGGKESHLHDSGDLLAILRDAKPVTDPESWK